MQGQNPLRQGRRASHGNSKLGKQSKYELEQKMNGKLQRKTINGSEHYQNSCITQVFENVLR